MLPGVYNKCPQTCGIDTSSAEDSTGKFGILVGKSKKIAVTCQWVGNKDTLSRCKIGNIEEICKKTCKMC